MQSKLKSVTDMLQEKIDLQNKMEADAKFYADRLDLANRLMGGLTDEGKRWEVSVKGLEEKARTLVGDVLLAAAFVSYIGCFNQKFRVDLWREKWLPDMLSRQIPHTPGVDPLFMLANDSDFAKWKNGSFRCFNFVYDIKYHKIYAVIRVIMTSFNIFVSQLVWGPIA